MSNPDILTPRGELEIWKVYDDCRPDECVLNDHNIITSGLGISLAYLYAGSGASSVLEYQVNMFQIGSGTTSPAAMSLQQLNDPLDADQYKSAGSFLATEERQLLVNEAATGDTQTFVRIPYTQIQKVGSKTIRYTLILDKNSANDLGKNLKEVGLFMKNPRGGSPEASVLIAYRQFDLPKASDFALVFKWSIIF
jgi:sporulation protein YlmC with PRC-barrel domain